MLRTCLVLVLVFSMLFSASPSVRAGGVVTVCDETHLRAALVDGGAVTFACNGTISLSSTLFVMADTTIDGGGHEVILDGQQAVRIMTVNESVKLNLRELGFANGGWAVPGALFNNAGIVTVSRCTFTDNDAAILNGGALTVVNSTFTGNNTQYGGAGAISNTFYSTLMVSNSTFSGNSAEHGGGAIANASQYLVTISNSTFSDNHSGSFGGAIWNGLDRNLTVANCTFAGNSASLEGGTIFTNGSHMTLTNTIIADSSGGSACYVNGGLIGDGGGNLSFPDATCPGINRNPVLAPLHDNGGSTHTMALGSGSAAIDAADDGVCAGWLVNNQDQRGVTRPQGLHCDIGAYEVGQAVTSTPTPTRTPTSSLTPTVTATTTATTTRTPTQNGWNRLYLPVLLR